MFSIFHFDIVYMLVVFQILRQRYTVFLMKCRTKGGSKKKVGTPTFSRGKKRKTQKMAQSGRQMSKLEINTAKKHQICREISGRFDVLLY
jgi:hypothetical protein